MIHKLSNEQIHEIADMIGTGYHVCYINPKTGEVEIIFTNELLDNYGISWDDDEEEEEENTQDDSSPGWQDELYADVKAQMSRIYSWEQFIRVEKPESHEAFEFMERFVDEIIPEGKLKQDFWKALSRKHPFSNFNAIVHNCKYREDWFRFKQMAMEEYVKSKIGQYCVYTGGMIDRERNGV